MARADWEVFAPIDYGVLTPDESGLFTEGQPFTLAQAIEIYPGGGPSLKLTAADSEEEFSQISLLRTAEDGVVGGVGVAGSFVLGFERETFENSAVFANASFFGNFASVENSEQLSALYSLAFQQAGVINTSISSPGVSVVSNPGEGETQISLLYGLNGEDVAPFASEEETEAVFRVEFYVTRLQDGLIAYGSRGFKLTGQGFSTVPTWAIDYSFDQEFPFPLLDPTRRVSLSFFSAFFRYMDYTEPPSFYIDTVRFSRLQGVPLYSGARIPFEPFEP